MIIKHNFNILEYHIVKMSFLAKCLQIKPPKVYNLKEDAIEFFF